MKVYVITTGAIFGLITVAHLLRIFTEGSHMATNPFFILLTVVSAALCVWAVWIVRRPKA